MRDELVGLLEGALVEQELDAFARRHLAFLVLPVAALLAPTRLGQPVAPLQFCELLLQVHAADYKEFLISDF